MNSHFPTGKWILSNLTSPRKRMDLIRSIFYNWSRTVFDYSMKANLLHLTWDGFHYFHLQTALCCICEAKFSSTVNIFWQCQQFSTLVWIFHEVQYPQQKISACCSTAVVHPEVLDDTDALILLVPASCVMINIAGNTLEMSEYYWPTD